jgi:hypothetical protein
MSPTRRPPTAAIVIGRLGLAARTAFYLLLVYLIVRVAVASHGARQTNANGALSTVAKGALGTALLAATTAGFLGFGLLRMWGAARDGRASRWSRAGTALQGAFYVVLAWFPLSYAIGNRSTGTEQQQHQTAGDLLHLPGGQVIVFALGLVIVGACAVQIWNGVDRNYIDGMAVDDAPAWVRTLVLASGTFGIPARALTFVPLGVFFMIAAVQGNPARADGLDGELTSLTGSAWGDVVLALGAVGLLVFAVYSAMEVRYREVARGR